MFLIKRFCTAYYGSVIWDFYCKKLDDIDVKFKKCIRKIYLLPNHSRSNIIWALSSSVPASVMIHSRFVKFYDKALKSSNRIVSMLARLARITCNTVTGANLVFLNNVYNVSMFRKFCVIKAKRCILNSFVCSQEVLQIASVIEELTGVLDGESHLDFFDPVLLRSTIHDLSVAR